jgi:hypothetical protein
MHASALPAWTAGPPSWYKFGAMDGIGTPSRSLSATCGARVPAYYAWRFI